MKGGEANELTKYQVILNEPEHQFWVGSHVRVGYTPNTRQPSRYAQKRWLKILPHLYKGMTIDDFSIFLQL